MIGVLDSSIFLSCTRKHASKCSFWVSSGVHTCLGQSFFCKGGSVWGDGWRVNCQLVVYLPAWFYPSQNKISYISDDCCLLRVQSLKTTRSNHTSLQQPMFNNNSAQILQNSQTRTYPTRQTSQGPQNIFTNTAFSTNPFSNQPQQNSVPTQNIFNNQSSSQNIFSQGTNQNTNINPFSSRSSVPHTLTYAANDQNAQASLKAFHQQDLLRTLNQFHQLQSDSDLLNLMKILDLSLQKSEGLMNKAMKEGESLAKESTDKAIKFRKQMKERCLQIKARNSAILQEMLNLRAKVTRTLYQFKRRSQKHELQMENILQKIHQSTESVKKKRTQYFFQKQFNATATKSATRLKSLGRPLSELRKVTERLQREAIQVREQFQLFVSWLRQSDDI